MDALKIIAYTCVEAGVQYEISLFENEKVLIRSHFDKYSRTGSLQIAMAAPATVGSCR